MIQAVIFDLYGVLAVNGWQTFKAKHFADRPAVWSEVFELGRQVDAGLADYDDFVRFTAEQAGVAESAVRYELEHTVANEELLRFIETTLKGKYRLGILSNASSNQVIQHVFTVVQAGLFDVITLSHHVGLTKPQLEMYHAAAERLNVAPSDCLFIDDQERHVTGAREAGMRAVVYTDIPQLQLELEKLL